jgi:hypothetical protein
MYFPVPYQRRFAFGLQPVLAVLAAVGWPLGQQLARALAARLGLPEALQPSAARRLTMYPLLTLGFTATLASYLAVTVSAASNQPVPIYMVDRDTYALGTWIAERSGPDDVVAGSFNTGNALAGLLPGRVVLGYDVATLHAREKRLTLEAIYRGELSTEEIRAFLAANRVSYLVVGPEERKLGPEDPGARLGLPEAARVGEAIAYRAS